MMVLVSYDVQTITREGERRLRRIAKACQNYGQRVQLSVFEIEVDPAQWVALRSQLHALIDPATDSLRFYHLGKEWRHRVEHIGAKPSLDLNDPLVF